MKKERARVPSLIKVAGKLIGSTEAADGAAAGAASKRKERKVNLPKIVTQDEWLAARREFLVREKEFTRQRDALSEARRKLPMVKVEKEYVFDGPRGAVTLRDLFEGRRIVYHFMFDPDRNAGCKHCSCVMDNIAGSLVHLPARETSFAAVSRAPVAKLEAFKRRMQWTFPWVSSFNNDFNTSITITTSPWTPTEATPSTTTKGSIFMGRCRV